MKASLLAALAAFALPVFAQLAPPTPPSTPTSRELAAQAPAAAGGLGAYHQRIARYVKDRRVDVLQAHFEERLAALARGEITDRTVNYMFVLVGRTGPTETDVFDRWVDAHPGSFVGPLARAHYPMRRAWKRANGSTWRWPSMRKGSPRRRPTSMRSTIDGAVRATRRRPSCACWSWAAIIDRLCGCAPSC